MGKVLKFINTPWHSYVLQRFDNYLKNFADHRVHDLTKGAQNIGANRTRMADHPALDVVHFGVPGLGRIRELNFKLVDLNGYTREKFIHSIVEGVKISQKYFPTKVTSASMWKVNDNVSSPSLTEAILSELASEFDGVKNPRIMLVMDNLAAYRNTPTSQLIGLPDGTSFAAHMREWNKTYGGATGFQALTSWERPWPETNPNDPTDTDYCPKCEKTKNAYPRDCITTGLQTFGATYFEIYSRDFEFSEYASGLRNFDQTLCDQVTNPVGLIQGDEPEPPTDPNPPGETPSLVSANGQNTLYVNPPVINHARLKHMKFRSNIMNRDIGVNIYLPLEYEQRQLKRFPVVYHFHGQDGNESTNIESLISNADSAINNGYIVPFIYVFVNALGDSFYTNAKDNSSLFENVFIEELIPAIEANHRTWNRDIGRALEGFAMGGFGALNLASKHPEMFSSVVSYGASLYNQAIMQNLEGDDAWPRIFGSDPEYFSANDPRDTYVDGENSFKNMFSFKLFIGLNDPKLVSHRSFRDDLIASQYNFDYQELNGVNKNDQSYIDSSLIDGFKFHNNSLSQNY